MFWIAAGEVESGDNFCCCWNSEAGGGTADSVASCPVACQRMKCPENDPLPIPHDWYQAGDLLIGGITSQVVYNLHEPFFEKHPSRSLPEVPT